jgi:hypothetical protein
MIEPAALASPKRCAKLIATRQFCSISVESGTEGCSLTSSEHQTELDEPTTLNIDVYDGLCRMPLFAALQIQKSIIECKASWENQIFHGFYLPMADSPSYAGPRERAATTAISQGASAGALLNILAYSALLGMYEWKLAVRVRQARSRAHELARSQTDDRHERLCSLLLTYEC